MTSLATQNGLLLNKLLEFYNKDNNLQKILNIINGESQVSLRLIDWFATNYSKKNFTVRTIYVPSFFVSKVLSLLGFKFRVLYRDLRVQNKLRSLLVCYD